MSEKSTRPPRSRRARRWGRAWSASGAAILAMAFAQGALACDLVLKTRPDAVRIDYNPFAVGAPAAPLDVAFENRGEAGCDLRLSFTDDAGIEVTGVALGGVGARFRPRESSGVTEADVQPGVFRFQMDAGASAQAQLDAVVVQEAVPEAGEHGVDLNLVVRDPQGVELLPPIPVRLVLFSAPRAQLNLAGAAGAFGSGSSVEVVDFGDAVTGATRRIFVQVRANALSILTVLSKNGGEMHRVEPVENATTVPYAVELDGQPVDLTALWSREVDPPRTLAGASFPMVFTLGEVGSQMAGRYEDLITIDVFPK